MTDIAKLKEARHDAHQDLRRSDRKVERQRHLIDSIELDRRELAEEGGAQADIDALTKDIEVEREQLDNLKETRKRRAEDFKEAKRRVDEAQDAKEADYKSLKINTSPGAPHWGGVADVFHALMDPVAEAHGIGIGSTKEPGHAVGGDHDPNMVLSYATDYLTKQWHDNDLRDEQMRAVGVDEPIQDYGHYFSDIDGHTIRFQPIFSPHGSGVHGHQGGRLID